MGNAAKCPRCGSYYNASDFSNCPYCEKEASRNLKQTSPFCKVKKIKEEIVHRFREEKTEVPFPSSSLPTTETQTLPSAPPFQEQETVPVSPAPTPLEREILESSRTIGKYIFDQNGESRSPVVGWLVGTKGNNYGLSFPLKSGKNRIGRSHEMDVSLLGDDSVSRTCMAVLIFDPRANEFSLLPGESDSLCYVNGSTLYDRVTLSGYDEIELGESGYNCYVFVPFCGARFQWKPTDQHEEV